MVTAAFPPMKVGGADYALRLCQRLAERGLEIDVITSDLAGIATDARLRIAPIMRDWSWRELPRLLARIQRSTPDIVDIHFHGRFYGNHPMVTFLPSLIKRRWPGLRVVTHIEWPIGVPGEGRSTVSRIVRRAVIAWVGRTDVSYGFGTLLRDSDAVIVLSDTHRVMLEEEFARIGEKTVLIPPPPLMQMAENGDGAARREGRTLLHADAEDFVLAYFGYLYPRKGVETLLEALRLVGQQRSHVRLVMIGGSLNDPNRPHYRDELTQRAAELGVAGAVTWTGYYPTDSNIASLYLRAADCCVLPFDRGVYLNNSSFAAAMAHGLPTISTPGDPLEPPFRAGENVLFCEPKDPASLAHAIESLIASAELRERLHAGALAFAAEWFSWDRVLDRTIAAFQ